MAITRAQQAKQMLQDGGRIGFFTGMREQEQEKAAADRRERNAAANYQRSQTFDFNPQEEPPPGGTYDAPTGAVDDKFKTKTGKSVIR